MICKNCGNDVMTKMSGAQIVLTLFLCIFGLWPGILYLIMCRKVTCPACGKNVYEK